MPNRFSTKDLMRTTSVIRRMESLRHAIGAGLCLVGILFAGFALGANSSVTGYSGSTWTVVPSPNTDPAQENQLWGVTCPQSSECWAVGYYNNGSYPQTLVEHWDGVQWQLRSSPNTSVDDANYL